MTTRLKRIAEFERELGEISADIRKARSADDDTSSYTDIKRASPRN
ncbi:hypothetical protein [Mycobacteroides abscessus]|nr:hypothetical protein [Mycobacteroides abscessus]MBE5408274.1 hypothetical protein [Mycobacteroides abscessus]SLC81449.1 Uncharacterised protein [Mycobacteroides abscessus subsp. massiliense]